MNLTNKKIIIAVSGGIAAYKSCELIRILIKKSAIVRVIMTKSACEFVRPLTFESLTNHNVLSDLFPNHFTATQHIDWADWADCIILVPATANSIAKLANGFADDIVSTVISASKSPVLIAPAMNTNMWENSIVQDNIKQLKKHNFTVMDTSSGQLACGWVGEGHLAELDEIVQYTYKILSKQTLVGKKILISSGPTIEDIDPVRFISNRSTGKMGNALAFSAWAMGADVTLISGFSSEVFPFQVQTISVRSASEMAIETKNQFKKCDIFISAAAVADYTLQVVSKEKIKKSDDKMSLPLIRTTDILKTLIKEKNQIIVGFAMETDHDEENALKKLKSKNLDAIILNNLNHEGAGFAHETNCAKMFFSNGKALHLDKQSKLEMSFKIWSYLQ